MKHLVALLLCCVSLIAVAQKQKIAVFTPLYVDSALTSSGAVKYKTFPKSALPGLEFYYGVNAALDSLRRRGAPLDVYIYDSKSPEGLTRIMARPEMRDVNLIIGHTNVPETRFLAGVARERKIPFVSATLPNDAGLSSNPYMVIMNPSLQAHVEEIYAYVQKNNPDDHIVVFRKPGAVENMLKGYMDRYAQITKGPKLKLEYVDLGADLGSPRLASYLDSSLNNVVIVGSLDEAFGTKIVSSLNKIAGSYPVRVFGMPTWSNIPLERYSSVDVVYTSPYYHGSPSELETELVNEFTDRMSTGPTDMFFSGYDAMMRFGLLLLDTRSEMASNLTRNGNTVISKMEIQPVFKNPADMNLDYFENRHLYFIRNYNGVKSSLN